jgi:hypothetical protein
MDDCHEYANALAARVPVIYTNQFFRLSTP